MERQHINQLEKGPFQARLQFSHFTGSKRCPMRMILLDCNQTDADGDVIKDIGVSLAEDDFKIIWNEYEIIGGIVKGTWTIRSWHGFRRISPVAAV